MVRRNRIRLWALACTAAMLVGMAGCTVGGPTASPRPSRPAAAGQAVVNHPRHGALRFWTRALLHVAAAVTRWPGGHAHKSAHPVAAPPRRVGALLFHNAAGNHFCTASVVDSPHHNVIATAAHCVHGGKGGGYQQDIVFAPGYHQGQTPYGVWQPTAIIVDRRWITSSDPDLDIAFVVLAPLNGTNIGDILSGNQLVTGRPDPMRVRVIGYPNSADTPITCTGHATAFGPTQQRFACGGYATGTSGSPWITGYNTQTHTGQLVGVIGGYQQGGDTAAVSYSPTFGADVSNLYHRAATHTAG